MLRNATIMAGVACLALTMSACGDAIKAVDNHVVSEDVTGISQDQLDAVRELAKTDAGLAALEKAGYVATASVTPESGAPYLRFKVCDRSARPLSCRKNEAPTAETPDVHVNLAKPPTDASITPNGTYSLAYPVGDKGMKYRYLCTPQGETAPTNETAGLTADVVGEFGAIGAVVVDATDKARRVGNTSWKCDHQVLQENIS